MVKTASKLQIVLNMKTTPSFNHMHADKAPVEGRSIYKLQKIEFCNTQKRQNLKPLIILRGKSFVQNVYLWFFILNLGLLSSLLLSSFLRSSRLLVLWHFLLKGLNLEMLKLFTIWKCNNKCNNKISGNFKIFDKKLSWVVLVSCPGSLVVLHIADYFFPPFLPLVFSSVGSAAA